MNTNTHTTIPTKVVSFRVSHEEYNQLMDAANAQGQRIGHYCYNKVFAAAAEPKKEKPSENKLDAESYSDSEIVLELQEKLNHYALKVHRF